MNNLQKIWLCGITSNEFQNVSEILEPIHEYFDGLVWVWHKSEDDGTKELLEKYKGDGEIVEALWQRNHGTSYQMVLNSRKILAQDHCIIIDSCERLNLDFCKNLRSFIYELEKNNINTVYNHSKILMFKYWPDIYYSQDTPHCIPRNLRQNVLEITNIPQFADEKNHRYNVRPQKRPQTHFLSHFFKYSLSYHRSNQMSCGNETNPEEYQRQESARQQFLIYCYRVLGFEDITEEIMIDFIKKNGLLPEIKAFFNFNRYLNNWYRYHFLNHSLDDIIKDNTEKKLFQIL